MIELKISAGDEVWTSDDYQLGVARSLHFRPVDEVNPKEKLYAVYLKVVNYVLGDELFIPTEYLDAREDADEPLTLTVPLKVVMQRAWSRSPEFAAQGLGREERLIEASQEATADVATAHRAAAA